MRNFYPFIINNRTSKHQTTPLYVRYNYHRNKKKLINTGYNINPIHWDEKKKKVRKSCPNYEEISSTLTKMLSKIGEILIFAKENNIDPTTEYLVMELEKNKEYEQKNSRINLFVVLDKYIEEKTPFVSKDQIKDYKTLRKHLTAFKEHSSQPINFRNINLKFYNEFMDYLYNKAVKPDKTIGLVTNSAGKIIRLLKGFINYQIAKETIPFIDLKHFKVVEEETDAIYLTEKELKLLYELDLRDNEELDNVRDIFLIGCYTGLRYSDLSSLKEENFDINNENINIKQRKVHKAVTIPMIDYVPEILKKYNYMLPNVSSYKFNVLVKELGKKIRLTQKVEVVRKKGSSRISTVYKKYELISSHTCRRSFCTNMHLAKFPTEELMKISGHKSQSAFLRYIKIDNVQAAEHLKEFRKKYNNN